MGNKLLVLTNSAWNVRKFRKDLIRLLCKQSYSVGVACPDIEQMNGTFKDSKVKYFDTGAFSYARLNPLDFLRSLVLICRINRSFKPDLTLSFTIKPNLLNGLVCRLYGSRYIPVITGLGTSFTQTGQLPSWLYFLYKIAFKKASHVVFQNKDDRQLFLERNIVTEQQSTLIYGSGVDSSYFKKESSMPDTPVFLLIGRLLKSKGIQEYYEASKEIANQGIASFQLLGSYDPKHPDSISPELFEEIKTSHIQYLGYSDEVKPIIEGSSIVVLPSYREGLPKSILEALSMERPIIVSNASGCKAFFNFSYRPGKLVQVQDVDSLRNAIEDMAMKSKDELIEMGREGRMLVKEHFDMKIVNQQFSTLINKSIE